MPSAGRWRGWRRGGGAQRGGEVVEKARGGGGDGKCSDYAVQHLLCGSRELSLDNCDRRALKLGGAALSVIIAIQQSLNTTV